MKKLCLSPLLFILVAVTVHAEPGYDLWLQYDRITNARHQKLVSQLFSNIVVTGSSETSDLIREELTLAADGMTGTAPRFYAEYSNSADLIISTDDLQLPRISNAIRENLAKAGMEGYLISYAGPGNRQLLIAANSPVGALYGTFHLLRILQGGELPGNEPIIESPKIKHRLLNHWDNLDRTVERGYAGFSIWDWHKLPGYLDKRYTDYARANASIGINGSVLTSVNANALILTPEYIRKVEALANLFRPFGIKVYLTARFSAPMEIGGLETADPGEPEVQEWWNTKAATIYNAIPDFGGFLVKADSEGQPGPHSYNRSHAEGANMLADAVAPFGGIVMWRAFVYSDEMPEDRARQANSEFEPLDGSFRDNVIIQVKNGPIDFQPREPFHPLFGAMPGTTLALELQITQEYLGQATSLAYLAPMYKECMESVTYRPNKESTVADIIDGTAYGDTLSVIAGVANTGTDLNWTGHPFGQSNWYAFGRLAWDHTLGSEVIADEWIKATFGIESQMVQTITEIMRYSHEMVVNYMTPLGLHHIMGRGHHYGPGPWVTGGRADWTSLYYHRADSLGIGFNRTSTGSDALNQYAEEIERAYSDPSTCPEKFLLWFHHLPWNQPLQSGNSLWEEICYKYDTGVRQVEKMNRQWKELENMITDDRYRQVAMLMKIQLEEAEWWRNSCLLYFQQFSNMPFPEDITQPEGDLQEYMEMRFPYAPGIRPSW